MEILALLAACFVLLPLPLCIYLLRAKRRQEDRLDTLETELAQLRGQPPEIPPLAPARAPEPPQPVEQREPTPAESPPLFIGPMRPVAAPPSQARARISDAPQQPPALVVLLRALGCWPPEDYARREAGIIQWWAPRVGGLLAVLTVIFSAVYISRGASPWIRFIELLAADFAAIALGAYFLKRRPRFGSILLSVGLTMLYVTIVAGYAAPPTRVFENPIIGIACQFAAVAGIYVVSLRLRDPSIAVLATALGLASSVFSGYVGLNEGALLSAIALQATGLAVGSRWRSRALLSVSSVGSYLPLLAYSGFALIHSRSFTTPDVYSALAFLGLAVSGLPLATLIARLEPLYPANGWRALQIGNTTLFAATGFLYFKLIAADLVLFYGSAAALLLLWAGLFVRRGLGTLLFQLFFLKGSAMAALWASNYFSGELRWFALAVELALLAWTARQARSRWAEAAAFALWAAAAVLCIWDLDTAAALQTWSASWLLFLAAPALATAAFAFLRPAWDGDLNRSALYALACFANGVFAVAVIARSNAADSAQAIYLSVLAALFAGLAALPRFNRALPVAASAPLLLASHLTYWFSPHNEWAFAATALVTLAFAYAASRFVSGWRRRNALPELALLSLVLVSLYAFLVDRFASAPWLPLLLPAMAIALFAARPSVFRASADLFAVALALDLAFGVDAALGPAAGGAKLALYGALLALPIARPSWLRRLWIARWRRGGLRFAQFAAVVVALRVALDLSWLASELFLVGAAAGCFALWRGHRHRSALASSALLFLVALAKLALSVEGGYAQPWASHALAAGAALSVATLVCGAILWSRTCRRISDTSKTALTYAFALASYASIAVALGSESPSLQTYYTPLLALFCLLLIGVGIAARVKPYRIVALAGFALPLGRLFLYDIRETLYRIVAFAALAALLTLIGYLYNRFAARIE